MGSSLSLGFGWVRVPARGFKSQSKLDGFIIIKYAVYPQPGISLFTLTPTFSRHLLISCHYKFVHMNLLSWNASNLLFRSAIYPSSSNSKPTSSRRFSMVVRDRCNLVFFWTTKAYSFCLCHSSSNAWFSFNMYVSSPPSRFQVQAPSEGFSV